MKRTIVSFIGVLIGTISVLKIYPLAFDAYGVSQFVISCATLLSTFASLGITRLTIKFFPEFRDERNGHNGFLGLLLTLAVVSFFLFVLLFILVEPYFLVLLELLGMDSSTFFDNKKAIFTLSFIIVLSSIFTQHATNFQRVVIPEIFNNLFLKISLPILILAFFYGQIDLNLFTHLLPFIYFIALVALVIYISTLGELHWKPNLKRVSSNLMRQMIVYGLFNALSVVGYLISFRIDSIMISSFMDFRSTGYYSFYAFMANAIAVPYISMVAISSPLISQAFEDNDVRKISNLYRQSSEILFIGGLYIFIGIWLCLDNVLQITGKFEELQPLRSVFLLLGLGQLVNITTGLNEPIIGYSRHYRFNLYAISMLAVINVGMNLILIPKLGIIGAALATAIALISYNLAKCIYIYIKFDIIPISAVHFKVLFISCLCLVASLIPLDAISPVLQILIKGSVFTAIYIGLIIKFKISLELNQLWDLSLDKIRISNITGRFHNK